MRPNSTVATAKTLLYARVPAGVSPRLTWMMYEVMVCTGTSGLSVRIGRMPAAIATSIVSPMARETARIHAAMIPDIDDGITTRKAICNRVDPKPWAAIRKWPGTARIASSLSDATNGRIITPITMPGDKALKPARDGMALCSSGVTVSRAKYP